MSELLAFWGKAQPHNADGPAFHPLAYHCLDVAACLQEILTRNPLLRLTFARVFGVEGWLAALVFLAALHDIGKFARKFQGKVEGLFPLALGKPPKHPSYNHAEGGYAVLVSAELAPLIESLFKGSASPTSFGTRAQEICFWGKPPRPRASSHKGSGFKPTFATAEVVEVRRLSL